jgi:PEP-CTERM motif
VSRTTTETKVAASFEASRPMAALLEERSMNTRIMISVVSVIGAVSLAAPQFAHAETIPFNLAETIQTVQGDTSFTKQLNSPATGVGAQASFNASGSWGGVAGAASADLSTGVLRAIANSETPPSATSGPFIESEAKFGDGFTTKTSGGQPFLWTSSTTAYFGLELGGIFSGNHGDTSIGFARAGGVVSLFLQIMDPGTLNPNAPTYGGPAAIESFLFTFEGTNSYFSTTNYLGQTVEIPVTHIFGGLPNELVVPIQPGGDFDWSLSLEVSGATQPGYASVGDLSDPVTVSYQGPAGTVTSSASGLFNNYSTTVVPEPSTWAMMALGFGGLGLLARAKGRPQARAVLTL